MEACDVWMSHGKTPLWSEAGQRHSHSLDFPSFMSLSFLSFTTETSRTEIRVCEEQLCAPIEVSQSSLLLFVLLCRDRRVASKGHSDGGVKGLCTYSEPVLDPLMKRDVNRNTNKYRHRHKAALCDGASVNISFVSLAFLVCS